jgi:hypothetical protein
VPPENAVELPASASDEDAAVPSTQGAYLKNPIAGREMLTPIEVFRAISILAAMLEADEYRVALEGRKGPDGQ